MSTEMNAIIDLEKVRSALLSIMEKIIDPEVSKALQDAASANGGTQCEEVELVESDGTFYAIKG